MQLHKAVRHLILAQAQLAARSLRVAGNGAAAAEIERTATALQFAGSTDAGIDGGAERASGRAAVVTLQLPSGQPVTRTIDAGEFQLYSRDGEGLAADGSDRRAVANAARAAEIFAELHSARIGAPLDAAVAAALRGTASASAAATASAVLPSVIVVALLMTVSAWLADGAGRVINPLVVVTAWWGSRQLSHSAWINGVSAAVPLLLWRHEPAAAALLALAGGAAIVAWLAGENADDMRAISVWTLAGGVAAGALAVIQPAIGGALLAGMALVWGAGWLLFVRFRPIVIALAAAGTLAGVGIARLLHDRLFALRLDAPATSLLTPALGQPALLTLMLVLSLLAVGGWFTGTHRRPVAMLLPLVLLAVAIGTIVTGPGWSLHGLSVVTALTLTLAARAWEPLALGRARRRAHKFDTMQAGG